MRTLITILHLVSLSLVTLSKASNEAEVKGMFVFGSSLVDNGNNNFLKNATAKANFCPYGIDFPLGPSGRFSNGRNAIDVLGELLKLPGHIPPFTDPRTRGARIVHGVNFASGGSGILDQTGAFTGQVLSLNQQIRHFEITTLPELRTQLRRVDPKQRLFEDHHLSKYLFVVGTGGNDYMQYFVTSDKDKLSLPIFTRFLISAMSHHLKQLYDLGARKFVLFSVQAMGCYPVMREALQARNGSCVEAINDAALLFNSHLKSLAGSSKAQMPGSNMVFIDSYKIIRDIIDNPIRYGFLDTSKPCCEVSGGIGILCKRDGRTCGDRSVHVYFDGLHPTEAVNVRIAHKAYGSDVEEEAYPTNVKILARL